MGSQEMPTDVAILAYAAGLFDGEGSISIVLVKQNKNPEILTHRLMLSLTNTDAAATRWMKLHFGGFISKHCSSLVQNPIHKTSERWQCSNLHAEKFLKAVLPFLILKAERAELGLKLRETRLVCKGGPGRGHAGEPQKNPVTDNLYAYRETLRQRVLQLNKRGAIPVAGGARQ